MAKSKGQPSEVEKILENPDELSNRLFQSGEFFVKYRTAVFAVLGAVVLGVAGLVYYQYKAKEDNAEAQRQMYGAVLYFEMDSLETALEGNLMVPGLLSVTDEYGHTQAGKLANFYVGAIYLRQGKFEEAIKHLKEFKADDLLVQARAYSLIGDAYMELQDYANALSFYSKAASFHSNEEFSPVYLMKAALASELSNDYKTAVDKYNLIVNQYPASQQVSDARKYKSRAEGLLNSK